MRVKRSEHHARHHARLDERNPQIKAFEPSTPPGCILSFVCADDPGTQRPASSGSHRASGHETAELPSGAVAVFLRTMSPACKVVGASALINCKGGPIWRGRAHRPPEMTQGGLRLDPHIPLSL